MSAVLKPASCFEAMAEDQLDAVFAIERRIYEFPWTVGNFRDSIRARYTCRILRDERDIIGYAVMMLGAGEAHLLNLSISDCHRRRGFGGRLLRHLIGIAREHRAQELFLEVRPSNEAGLRLYGKQGFRQTGVRRGYYPATAGREDALILSLPL